jgi:serine/threonine-protein kinase
MTTDASGGSELPNDRELFKRTDAVFDEVLDLEPTERDAYVQRACAGDEPLRRAVERLLRAHEQAGEFLMGSADTDGMLVRALASEDGDTERRVTAPDGDDVLYGRVQGALGERYRLECLIARGGMATVYRAIDVRHRRQVAVKALDARLAAAIDRDGGAERFLSEIHVTAGLQHPNILPLFDSGAADGVLYYVMPFMAGESLRQRLNRESPLPVDDAIRIASAVAGGLAHAHARGVVHRDLKPENILLQDGHPVVADFGIALAAREAAGVRLTQTGFTVGTPQYMAPEQAYGNRPIDARADIYALGAMTYEMLTGEPPHHGASAHAILAKRQTERPTPVRVLRSSVPPHVDRAVQRALETAPVDRFATADQFAEALATPTGEMAPAAATTRSEPGETRSRRWLMAAGLVAVATAIAIGTMVVRRDDSAADASRDTASRFIVAPDPAAAIGRPPTITPDGSRLVYAGAEATGRRLFVRRVNELTARPLPGTEGALSAFVSPDGKWIGFLTNDDRLKKVAIDGGPVTELTGAFRYASGSWGPGDHIVLAHGLRSLMWISANGGPAHRLSQLDAARRETRHSAPLVLDDGRTVIFTVERDRSGPVPSAGELAVVTIDSTTPAVLPHKLLGIKASAAIAVVDGWLLYGMPNGRSVMAIRFDAETRGVSGAPISVLEDSAGAFRSISLARNGTLLYTRGGGTNTPLLVDSSGRAKPMFAGVRGAFMNPRFSPDGRRLAIQGASQQGTDVWIYDVASGTRTQATTAGSAIGPTWTPDGRRIVYLAAQGGQLSFWSQPVDGSGLAERIVASDGIFAVDVAPDGRTIVFQRQVDGAWGIWAASLDGDSRPRPIVVDRFDAFMPSVSPDGKWLAYAANVTGRYEIYVRPFPGPGTAVQISVDGGVEPAWTRDGRTVLFRGDRRMYAASLTFKSDVAVKRRVALFTDGFDDDMPMPHRNFDVAPDGHQYVLIGSLGDEPVQTIVVLDWLRELRARIGNR